MKNNKTNDLQIAPQNGKRKITPELFSKIQYYHDLNTRKQTQEVEKT